MKNINILGGGISGLTAALLFSKECDVTVNTIDFVPSHLQVIKHYDDFNIYDFFKKYNLNYNFEPIYKINKFVFGYDPIIIKSNTPLFHLFERGEVGIDKLLYEKCLNQGTLFSKELTVDKNDIIAFGAKKCNFYAFGGTYNLSLLNKDEISIFINQEKLPGAYLYLCSLNEKTSVILVQRGTSENIQENFNTFLSQFNLSNKLDPNRLSNFISGGAMSALPNSAIYNNKLVLGAAAGFTEYSRGYGAKYAILSAESAYNSIQTGENYDDLWEKEFKKDLELGIKKGILYTSLSNSEIFNLIKKDNLKLEDYNSYFNMISKRVSALKVKNKIDDLKINNVNDLW